MASIVDDRGFNQGFRPSPALHRRTERRVRMILDALGNTVNDVQGTVLEIGCGTGDFASLVAQQTQIRVVGSDLCKPFIDAASCNFQRSNLQFVAADFKDSNALSGLAPNAGFDAIYGNGILHHLYDDLEASLKRIHKMLRPGGRLAFFEPNLFNPYIFLIFSFPPLRRLARLEPDEMAFSKGFIENLLLHCGFAEVSVAYRDFLLPNTPTPMIDFVISASDRLEKWRATSWLAQSLMISATKPMTL